MFGKGVGVFWTFKLKAHVISTGHARITYLQRTLHVETSDHGVLK